MVSKPHCLNCLKSFVLSLVNGEVKRKVLMPSLMVNSFRQASQGRETEKANSRAITCGCGSPLSIDLGLEVSSTCLHHLRSEFSPTLSNRDAQIERGKKPGSFPRALRNYRGSLSPYSRLTADLAVSSPSAFLPIPRPSSFLVLSRPMVVGDNHLDGLPTRTDCLIHPALAP